MTERDDRIPWSPRLRIVWGIFATILLGFALIFIVEVLFGLRHREWLSVVAFLSGVPFLLFVAFQLGRDAARGWFWASWARKRWWE